ncbi:2,3-bisphosphoglycerate-independent phosphoglycerate mutase, partial [Candidatus Saccharibacteria bacterium]|nr:2,3-bisphosphoglycerate-independent phosphoglycerate mutase [Candidatus Saccharibacteria bacterium]
ITALEAIDIQLSRIAKVVDSLGGMMIITADHGNAEELIDPATGQPKSSHTTNPVPCIFYDNTPNREKYLFNQIPNAGLANVAATIATLLGQEDLPEAWQPSLISLKTK